VGASGAAALRPALHKAAAKGVSSVTRVTLESAEQSKKTLCLALLQEVSKDTLAVWKETLAVCKDTLAVCKDTALVVAYSFPGPTECDCTLAASSHV